ncbi:penicillin-binding protein 2 [bacterium]|nr:penicillin-binding protein 2 [bacterium]
MSWRKKTKNKKDNNSLYLLIVVVFLLFLACINKLYNIQIIRGDYFSDLALMQHQVHSDLKPDRGEILIEKERETSEELYALATNRDFALVYAIPKDIEKSLEISEKLYNFFDQEEMKNDIEHYFKKEDKDKLNKELKDILSFSSESEKQAKINEAKNRYNNLDSDTAWLEERLKKIEEKIEEKKMEIINNYNKILDKPNDPYEPIKKRVDGEDLKDLYIYLSGEDLKRDSLAIKNGQIYKNIDGKESLFTLDGISHVMESYRYYPESEIGSHMLGFVSYSDDSPEGNYGLEGYFNKELSGRFGYIKSKLEDDNDGLIINDKEYKRAVNGSDLVLTIDRAVQFYICNKLDEVARRHGADKGSVTVINPKTGAIIAMCSWPNFDPNDYGKVDNIDVYNNPVVFDEYEPGSVFKTITIAIALNEGKITPRTKYVDDGRLYISNHEIKNSDFLTKGGHGEVDMNYVLEHSLNTGAIYAMDQVGPKIFADYVKKFGFGSKTDIELEAENDGNLANLSGENPERIYAATASFGQGLTVTPLQMVMAYAAIANNGILMKPFLVKKVIDEDGNVDVTKSIQVRRVVSEEASTLLSGMLVNVIEGGHAKLAAVPGYYVGGKTGTAEVASSGGGYGNKTIHTFVGYAPIEEPKFVMLVKLDDPKDVAYSASSAAPLFGEMAKFMLNYYQVPKTR